MKHLVLSSRPAGPQRSAEQVRRSSNSVELLHANSLMRLQRTAGNQAVLGLLGGGDPAGAVQAAAPLAVVQRVRKALPAAASQTGDAEQALEQAVNMVAPALRPILLRLSAAIRRNALTIGAAQARSLVGILRNLQQAIGHQVGTPLPEGTIGGRTVALSSILSTILRQDVSEILEGNDLFIPTRWLIDHPVILTGVYGSDEANEQDAPRQEQALSLQPPRGPLSPQVRALLHMLSSLSPDVIQFLQGYASNLALAAQVLLACHLNAGDAALLMPQCIPLRQAGMPPDQLTPVINFALNQMRQGQAATHLPLIFNVLRDTHYQPTRASQLLGLLLPAAPLFDDPAKYTKAVRIFNSSRKGARLLQKWIQTGSKPDAAPQPHYYSATSPFSGRPVVPIGQIPPMPTNRLGQLLGVQSFLRLRARVLEHDRPYGPNPFLADQAETLRATSGGDTAALLDHLCQHIGSQAEFAQAVRVIQELYKNHISLDKIRYFVATYPTTAGLAGFDRVIANLTGRENIAWDSADWAAMVGLIERLRNPPHSLAPTAIDKLLVDHLPDTDGLTLARLSSRLNYLVAPTPTGRGLVGAGIAGEFQALERFLTQRVKQKLMSAATAESARRTFRLLKIAPEKMNDFLKDVKEGLSNPPRSNPVNLLWTFARYHAGAAAVPTFRRTVAVPVNTGQASVELNESIVKHVLERHTFHNFKFDDAIIERAPQSSFFNPEKWRGTDAIVKILERQLQSDEVRVEYDDNGGWSAEREIQIGSYQMRIGRISGRYCITQFYWATVAEIEIRQPVLKAIQKLGVF
jgi:hypothetical protein